MSKNTENALLSRGFPSDLIAKLIEQNYTIAKLQLASNEELESLGLDDLLVERIRNEARPPIPEKTVLKLLLDSKSRCCICRENRPIIIHHILEWEKSKSHDEDNLVVLCHDHHDEAHTTRKLSKNLTADRIRYFKAEWLKKVKAEDIKATTTSGGGGGDSDTLMGSWEYFNPSHLLDLARNNNIDSSEIISIIKHQEETFENCNKRYRYDNLIVERHRLVMLFEETLQELLVKYKCRDLTDNFNRKTIKALIKEGSVFTLTRYFYFKKITNKTTGTGQNVNGYYHLKSNRLKVEFNIDLFDVLNNSSLLNLSKGFKCTSVLYVKNITTINNILSICCTCLAIGSGMREYESGCPSFGHRVEDDYEEMTSWNPEDIKEYLDEMKTNSPDFYSRLLELDKNNGLFDPCNLNSNLVASCNNIVELELPSNCFLDDPNPFVKGNQELKCQALKHEIARPQITLVINNQAENNITLVLEPLSEIPTANSLEDEKQGLASQTRLDGNNSPPSLAILFREMTKDISDKEYERYEAERQKYFIDYEKYLKDIDALKQLRYGKISFIIKNIGSAPATNVKLCIRFSNKHNIYENTNVIISSLKPPEKPVSPRKIKEFSIPKNSPFAPRSRSIVHSLNSKYSFKQTSNGDDFYYIEKYIQHCDSSGVEPLFVAYDKSKLPTDFSADYTIILDELPKPITGKINFMVSCNDEL